MNSTKCNSPLLQILARHYQLDEQDTLAEWRVARAGIVAFSAQSGKSKDFTSTVKQLLSLYGPELPLISSILQSLLGIVMTTADCEREFSVLKLVKTPLRNALGERHLNHAMMVAIDGPDQRSFDFSAAVKLFKASKKRRVV